MEHELTEPPNSKMETKSDHLELEEEDEEEEEGFKTPEKKEEKEEEEEEEEEEELLKTQEKNEEKEEQQFKTQEKKEEKHPRISATLPPSSSQSKPLQSQLQPMSTPPPPPPLAMPSSDHPQPPSPHTSEVSSPMPSPLHPIDSPSNSSSSSDQSTLCRLSSAGDETFHNKSPPSQPGLPAIANPASPPQHLAPVVSVMWSVRDVPAPLNIVDPGAASEQLKEGSGGGGGGGGGGDGGGGGIGVSGGASSTKSSSRSRPALSILRSVRRESTIKRALLVLRVCGCVLCLVSFSVLAADKNKGWALDSFYRYGELRYILAVNVVGFAYSGLQACDAAYNSATRKRVIQFRWRHYLDFFLDQVVSYLLLSASSSAATRVDDWVLNWGEDKFPQMATASVALSFLAFLAFALCPVISGYMLCTLGFS